MKTIKAFKLSDETIEAMEIVKKALGLATNTAVIEHLVITKANDLKKEMTE